VRVRRATLSIAVAAFVLAAVVATLWLGNALGSKSCDAGWTGYVPLGSCVKTFWSAAFYVGPLIGLFVGTSAGLLADLALQQAPGGTDA
jgi:heme/copper-type cytochrome/quinol oxidase subunit 1